ncbi:formimidoylglutamate deiminase [Arthrobacter caoxuetaonis]|uniref:Formimidoylglutamate deiminase n=1 Tax=Arthrobacter caoxuetaonis TaxID=2886935 RepID=A0A9X1MDZ1_9MICC|nr:formimidoylglutamate deiminase [Arthrobacter caoxuetaonis]MCC3298308.1 formimidoylglutamate deiminase [Arthrobacter caoxuetaonis]USQ57675.1 formimidoylglutamate deiminase [Arthrobacter caoxuetaonis]
MTRRAAGVWCEQAMWDGRIEHGVRLSVDSGGVVAAVETGAAPRPGDLVLNGVVFPAASNAHSHAFHRVLRGRTHTGGADSFWTWRQAMYQAAGTLTPDLYEEAATAVFAEMLTAGYTSVAEFNYVHHQPDGTPYSGHDMELALGRAARAAGIRLTLLDTCYLAGGFGEPLAPEQLRFGDGSAQAWLQRLARLREAFEAEFDPSEASIGAALHSVRAVPEEALADIAGGLDPELPLHIHVSEQPAENDACLRATGLTPVQLLGKHNLLSPRLSAIHATHLCPQDIELLGSAGATVVMCPTTEADLADGIGPAAGLASAGVRIALGSDQHAVLDPWLEMRALEHGERLASGTRGRFAPADLHQALSDGGAAAQGRRVPGFAAGRMCDLMAVDPASARTAGADPAQLALCATAQDVTAVVVGGVLAADRGQHVRLGDPGRLLATAIRNLDAAAGVQMTETVSGAKA